jgi:predicted DNA-binding transcriptional regulator YafY
MFEIIQLLRRQRQPITAAGMAEALEVTKRTVYRDIAALQSLRVPIEGEAGIGYIMRPGFDLPPLMFTAEEAEAIVVGLALLGRTGDKGLLDAARRAGRKIADVVPEAMEGDFAAPYLHASDWHAIPASRIDPRMLRHAIRRSETLALTYEDGQSRTTVRNVKPLAVVYYIEVLVLAAWCELRNDFRHFRIDRIAACVPTGERFAREAGRLRRRWRELHGRP